MSAGGEGALDHQRPVLGPLLRPRRGVSRKQTDSEVLVPGNRRAHAVLLLQHHAHSVRAAGVVAPQLGAAARTLRGAVERVPAPAGHGEPGGTELARSPWRSTPLATSVCCASRGSCRRLWRTTSASSSRRTPWTRTRSSRTRTRHFCARCPRREWRRRLDVRRSVPVRRVPVGAPRRALRRPRVRSLHDVFCAIRDDEAEHVATMGECQMEDSAMSDVGKVDLATALTLAAIAANFWVSQFVQKAGGERRHRARPRRDARRGRRALRSGAGDFLLALRLTRDAPEKTRDIPVRVCNR